MLSEDENDEGIEGEKVGINFQKFNLNSIVNNFHSIVIVDGMLILEVQIQKKEKSEDHDEGHLKGKEDNEGVRFEQYDEFKLDWKPWVLHLHMKYFLTPNRLIFILYFFLPLRPTTMHQINCS